MNLNEYIDSGILYDYCTGVLSTQQMAEVDKICMEYPEVKDELTSLQELLGLQKTKKPVEEIKEGIWNTLDNINKEKAGSLSDLPVINKYTNHYNWKKIVLPFMPAEPVEERMVKEIRNYGGVSQMLVVTRTDVEEEIHENEKESFIVLEGECECHIGDNIVRLGPGGFIEIPLHVAHNVRVLSPYVVAVLQHVAV